MTKGRGKCEGRVCGQQFCVIFLVGQIELLLLKAFLYLCKVTFLKAGNEGKTNRQKG